MDTRVNDILHDCCKKCFATCLSEMENFRHVKRRPLRVASTALPAVRRRGCARHGLRQNRTGVHRCSIAGRDNLDDAASRPRPGRAARARAGAGSHPARRRGAALAMGAPFLGILLTIATGPLLFPRLWHHHYGKLAFAWSVLTLAPLAAFHGISNTAAAFVHAVLAEYLSFIVLLFALYVVAGGILVTGNLRGTPLVNTAMLAFGTSIASVVGTTGAAMILIRPLLRANAARLDNVHVVVFFIFLVANIGGALSPLGDPPLFVGFLHGVDFFWTTRNLWFETVLVAALVLAAFLALDVWHYRRGPPRQHGRRGQGADAARREREHQPPADRRHHRGHSRFRDLDARHQLRRLRHRRRAAEHRARHRPADDRHALARAHAERAS